MIFEERVTEAIHVLTGHAEPHAETAWQPSLMPAG
jgi:hypothetical protein